MKIIKIKEEIIRSFLKSIPSSIMLKKGDRFRKNRKVETIIETFYEEGRLIRFRTARKEKRPRVIIESGYAVNEIGEIEQSSSGKYYEKDNPPFHASERYSELNKFLEEQKK